MILLAYDFGRISLPSGKTHLLFLNSAPSFLIFSNSCAVNLFSFNVSYFCNCNVRTGEGCVLMAASSASLSARLFPRTQ